MPHTRTKQVVNRLARVEGHVRSIRTMVAEGRACPEVLIQIAAARSALDHAARVLLEDHLEHCIVEAGTKGNFSSAVADLKEALDRFIGGHGTAAGSTRGPSDRTRRATPRRRG